MFVVALIELRGAVDAEAPHLAAALGTTVYEAALLLRGASPVVVLRTTERERAVDLLAGLRGRGHDAVACDAAAVVSSEAMSQVRSFRFEADALVLLAAQEERVAFSDVIALVRATHATRIDTTVTTRERRLSFGRAVLSGGVVMSRTVTKDNTHTEEDREPVLYVYRRAAPPVFLAASRGRYESLGADLRPSTLENFHTVVRRLREAAPDAVYDERLLAARVVADRVRLDSKTQTSTTSAGAVDLLAHIVAMATTRDAPYRRSQGHDR